MSNSHVHTFTANSTHLIAFTLQKMNGSFNPLAWLPQFHASLLLIINFSAVFTIKFQKVVIKLFTVWNVGEPVGTP